MANESAGYLFIPKGTKAVETSGLMCGYGYATVEIRIVDANGAKADYPYGHTGLLIQTAGNGYWRAALPNCIITLDETKDWYAYLYAGGYNGKNFEINNGYGNSGAWYGVKKIR